MQEFHEILQIIDSYIGGAQWFVFLLLGTGLFFTIYLKFPQLRYFGHALKVVKGKFDRKGDEGDASHFQALATAVSGTVGILQQPPVCTRRQALGRIPSLPPAGWPCCADALSW